jgi:hypothetical protein
MNLKQIIYQRITRRTFLFQKFADLELVNATMPRGLPFVAYKQTMGFRGEDQAPPILIGRYWPACAAVKLSLDRRHTRCARCFPVSIHSERKQRDPCYKRRPISN